MNRKSFFLAILIAAVVISATAFAQQQPHRLYNEIMKDVGATFPSLKKNLDSNNGAGAAEDAAKLEKFFSETEAFWTPLKTEDAINLSKKAREVAAAIGNSAKANDMKTALTSYALLQRQCGSCHTAHREDTGAGFTIKP
jgi:cytochrome c556